MGAQGFYRVTGTPPYSSTIESSPPLRLELGIAFVAPTQVVTHINYVLTKFPSDWSGPRPIKVQVGARVDGHEYSTQVLL